MTTPTPPLSPMREEEHEFEPPLGPGRFVVIIGIVLVVVVAGALLFAGARWLADTAAGGPPPTVVPGLEVTFTIPDGASARTIAAILEDRGVVADAGDFEREIRRRAIADRLRAGDYTVITGGSVDDLIATLTTGPPAAETYRLTVIEGLRIEEMIASLAAKTPYTFDELAEPLLDGTITSPYLPDEAPDGPAGALARWEGLLFPDTYEFVVDATPAEIVGRLADTMVSRVAGVDWSRLDELGIDRYQAIVVASLIEKEAKLDDDRPLIASVIYNRLAAGMLLQIDATVIYALGENPGRVLFEDLEIDSPYNTYRYPGLPPTPIGGVRLSSLEAAADPAESEYFFYVLIDTDGRHGFSETLEEHNAKVAKARADGVIP